MEELLPLLMLLFIAVPTVISISQAKNKQQEQHLPRKRPWVLASFSPGSPVTA